MTMELSKTYDSFKKTTPPGKGDPTHDKLTVEMARRIVGDVLRRRDEGMPRKKKSDEDEIDELVDSLDELDEDEDEEDVEEDEDEEDEDEDDEDDEDPDEAPKKSRKGKTSKAKAKKPVREGVGTTEVAEAAGIEPRQLRMYLRNKEIQPGDDREGRYHWSSLEHKEVKAILRDIAKGAVDKLNKEKIASLKGKKKGSAKKSTATKRTKVRSQKK